MTMPQPAETGRGAWTKRGNLLNRTLYIKGCSASLTSATTQDAWAVNRGVLAIQKILGLDYSTGPGIFGPKTDAAVRKFQQINVPPVDGLVGRNTAKALLRPIVAATETRFHISGHLLWGLIGQESGWDFGAVGATTPKDVGLVQINLHYNPTVTPDDAMNPYFALEFGAKRMADFAAKYTTQPVDRRWNGAVLNHHSPVWAKAYVTTGEYPTEAAKAYVDKVRTAAATW